MNRLLVGVMSVAVAGMVSGRACAMEIKPAIEQCKTLISVDSFAADDVRVIAAIILENKDTIVAALNNQEKDLTVLQTKPQTRAATRNTMYRERYITRFKETLELLEKQCAEFDAFLNEQEGGADGHGDIGINYEEKYPLSGVTRGVGSTEGLVESSATVTVSQTLTADPQKIEALKHMCELVLQKKSEKFKSMEMRIVWEKQRGWVLYYGTMSIVAFFFPEKYIVRKNRKTVPSCQEVEAVPSGKRSRCTMFTAAIGNTLKSLAEMVNIF